MGRVLTIAHLTLHEALRRRVLTAALIVGAAFLTLYAIGFFFVHREALERETMPLLERRVMFTVLTMAGLYAANLLLVLTAVLLPVDTLSGEIGSGVIQTVASKPVHRSEIVLGKWAGHWVVMAGYAALLMGGVLLVARLVSGFTPPGLVRGLSLILLEGTVLLTLSIAGGARLGTVTNGMVAFGLFGLAFVGNWVEQIGTFAGNQTARYVGTVASLVMPSDALWQLAASGMQPSILRDLGASPFSPVSVASPAMVAWAAGYVVVTLALGIRAFRKRPL